MTIHEPMTMATDYLLAGVAGWLSVLLFRSAQHAQKLWAFAFASLAMAALFGGTWHGFLKSDALWKATLIAAGGASFGMVAGSAVATLSGRARGLLIGLASVKLLAYCMWMLRHDEFIYVVTIPRLPLPSSSDSTSGASTDGSLQAWRSRSRPR
jgi:hypothetical protein